MRFYTVMDACFCVTNNVDNVPEGEEDSKASKGATCKQGVWGGKGG